MYCKTGKHFWSKPSCAKRCCDPEWARILLLPNEPMPPTADPETRIHTRDGVFVFIKRAGGEQ